MGINQMPEIGKISPGVFMVKGKSISEALDISNRAVAEALGGLPPVKMHCSVFAEEALKSAIEDYLRKKRNY